MKTARKTAARRILEKCMNNKKDSEWQALVVTRYGINESAWQTQCSTNVWNDPHLWNWHALSQILIARPPTIRQSKTMHHMRVVCKITGSTVPCRLGRTILHRNYWFDCSLSTRGASLPAKLLVRLFPVDSGGQLFPLILDFTLRKWWSNSISISTSQS